MTVFLVFFILLLALWVMNFVNDHNGKPLKRLRFFTVVVLGGYLFAVAALRHVSVGIDTKEYLYFFNRMGRYNWVQIMQMESEFGYFWMNKLVPELTGEFQVLLGLIAALYSISMCKFLYRYSDDVCLSFLIMMTVNFYYFSLCTLRQSVAMSILMFSLPYIIERRPVKFLLILAVACLFHNSALIFVLAYLLGNIKLTKKYVTIVLLSLAGTLVFSGPIISLLKRLYPSYVKRSSGSSAMVLLLYIGVEIIGLIYMNSVLAKDKQNKAYYNLSFLAIVFQILALQLDVVFRVSMYFSIFYIAFIPRIFGAIQDKRAKTLIYIGFVGLLVVAYCGFTYDNAGVYPYRFYWQ